MKLHQLQKLFKNLPLEFMEEIKEQDFKVCWYGSAGIDKRPMELFDSSHPDALIDETVKVFFYTDIEYITFVEKLVCGRYEADFENGTHHGYENMGGIKKGTISNQQIEFVQNIKSCVYSGNLDKYKDKYHPELMSAKMKALCDFKKNNLNDIPNDFVLDDEDLFFIDSGLLTLEQLKMSYEGDQRKKKEEEVRKMKEDYFVENYEPGARLVRHKRNDGENIYCFYIDCDDWTFEKLLINENLKINYVAHWGGSAGQGPRCLGNLQVEYGIGDLQTINDEVDFNLIPHKLEKIKEFNWHQIHDAETNKKTFYKVVI